MNRRSKASGFGKDPTTDEHLIALPPIYDNHPSVTGSIYKCRGITRLPRPNMWDTTFLATIHWPPMESMDYIEPDVSENYKYLQEHNTSTREQLAQQPPQFQPVEQPPQQPRREVVPKVPPQEPLGTTSKALPLRPPPGLEQVPPGLGTTSKAPTGEGTTYCASTEASTTTTCCWTSTTSTCRQALQSCTTSTTTSWSNPTTSS